MQKEVNKSEGGSLAATVWSELTVSWCIPFFFFFFLLNSPDQRNLVFAMKPITRTTFAVHPVLLPPREGRFLLPLTEGVAALL